MAQDLKARRAVVYIEMLAGIIAILRIFSVTDMLGEYGVTFYIIPYELFCVLLLLVSYGISESTSRMVRSRVERGQFRNAFRVLESAVAVSMILGIVIFGIMKLLTDTVANEWFGITGLRFALGAMVPVVVFRMITGAVRGFMNGYEVNLPSHALKILEEVVIWVGTYLLTRYYMGYGEKVGNLIQEEKYRAIYGAKGAAIALVIGAVIYMLLMILLYFVNRRRYHKPLHKDTTTRDENYGQVCHILMVYVTPMVTAAALFLLHHFLMMQYYISKNGSTGEVLAQYGNYYTGFRCVLYIPILFFALRSEMIHHEMQRNDTDVKGIREYVADTVRSTLLAALPVMVFVAVMGEPLLQMFLGQVNEISAYMLFPGSVLILLYSIVFVFSAVLYQLKKRKELLLILLIGNLMYFASITAFVKANMGIEMLAFAEIVFVLVIMLAEIFVLKRTIRYRQELVYSIFIPYIAAFVAGVILFVLNMVLAETVGALITILLGLVIGYFIYLFVIGALKGMEAQELEHYPSGGLILILLNKLRLL